MSDESATQNELYQRALEMRRPFYMLRPTVFLDGNMWCALYGDNIQDGVAGFGVSPEKAALDFDRNWCSNFDEDSEPTESQQGLIPIPDGYAEQ